MRYISISYDYPLDGDTLQVEDEEIKLLKFRKGDIINVYEQDTSGWYEAIRLTLSNGSLSIVLIVTQVGW
jgi:hypothetical protein